MSQDRKPAKIRLVSGADSLSQRIASAHTDEVLASPAGQQRLHPAEARLRTFILSSIFIGGCLIGGVALPLLHIG